MTEGGYEKIGLSDLPIFVCVQKQRWVGGFHIVQLSCALTAHDELAVIVKLDPKTRTGVVVPIDADHVDLDVKRGRLLALSNRRIESYGNLGLWTSSLFVGELPSFRYRRVELPFSYTLAASLRP